MAKKIYFYVMTAKHYTLFAVLTLATAAATILLQQYRFCSISADHQFICDSAWLTGHLCNAGGASLIIGSALSQWFVYPWTSGMAAALVYGTIAASTATLLRRRGVSGWLCMAGFVPCAFLFLAMENGSYGFRGHVAFALTSAALALADHLLTGCKRPTSAVGTALLGIALYHLAGSAALLIGACVAMLEIRDRRMPWGGLASLSCCVACGLMAVRRATFVSPTEALTPLQYYNWPSSFFFPLYAWAGLLLAVAAALEMDRRLKTDSRKCAGALTLVAVAVAIAANMFRLVHNPKTYQLRHEAYLAEHGRWDDIIALHRTDRQPVFFISYLNLALAQKGILPQQMDRYNQMDISERLGWQPMSTDGLTVATDVYYHIGFLAEARRMAFNRNMLTPGGMNPQALLKLAAVNAAMGESAVAHKYLHQARKAPLFAQAAMPHIGAKAPDRNRFLEIDFRQDLQDAAEADTTNHMARQFLEAYDIIWNKYRNGRR